MEERDPPEANSELHAAFVSQGVAFAEAKNATFALMNSSDTVLSLASDASLSCSV